MCLDAGGDRLLLAPAREAGRFALDPEGPASFRIAEPSGLLAVAGTLAGFEPVTVNGVTHRALRLNFSRGGVERQNRRNHFRVMVQLKGEIVPLGPGTVAAALRHASAGRASDSAQPHAESLGRALQAAARPCLVRDLSLGGARLSVASPAAAPGGAALLHVALDADEVIRNIPCEVLQSRVGTFPGPFDALVRVRFTSLPAPLEGKLGRFIARVQLEDLRRGIRNP